MASYELQEQQRSGALWYVTHVKGDGGKDWGWSDRPEDAVIVGSHWAYVFVNEREKMGRKVRAVKVSDVGPSGQGREYDASRGIKFWPTPNPGPPGEYQGHKTWNYWNVALYIANEYNLYQLALESLRATHTLDEAAAAFLASVNAAGIYETGDGATYTKATIREAIRDWRADVRAGKM